MTKSILFITCIILMQRIFAQEQYSIRDLKEGKFIDDSSYIYNLPFEIKKKVFLIQAYDSKMSHKGELALDFKVKKKTRICAARDGVVVGIRSDSEKGGLKPENLSDGNYISIKHIDGSVAHYWHLNTDGVFVKRGDSILKGQLIGLSGNTGYLAFPHLHFEVVGYDDHRNYRQLATRFATNKGVIYLRPAHFYKRTKD